MKKNAVYTQVRNDDELGKLLGLTHADTARLKLRTDLVLGIIRILENSKLTHMQAAEISSVGRTVITAIVNGNIQKISTDRLIEIADNLGVKMIFKIAS